MSKNSMRKWWVVLVLVHVMAAAVNAITTFSTIGQGNVAPIVVPVTIAGFVGLVVMVAGLFIQRGRFVMGSWVVAIGLLPTLFSITGAAVLLSGLWTANLAFREPAVAIGYKGISTPNREMLGRRLWVWIVGAALFFGLGWIGLLVDNWLLWVLPWGIAGMLSLAGIGMGVAVCACRHRTRPA